MKTTLNIDDTVMANLKQEAARRGVTMSSLVESALRLHLERSKQPVDLPPLPRWNGGGFLVDIDDRSALFDALDDMPLYRTEKD